MNTKNKNISGTKIELALTMTFHVKRSSTSMIKVLMTVFLFVCSEVTSVAGTGSGRLEPHKFTIEELLSMNFPRKDSGDIGLDPCKAGKFYLFNIFCRTHFVEIEPKF